VPNAYGSGVTVVTHPLSTNGIVYADLGLDLTQVHFDDVPLLPLFARMLTETGTKDLDRVALSRVIGARTGGVGASFMVTPRAASAELGSYQIGDPDDVVALFFMRGKATTDRAGVRRLFSVFSSRGLRSRSCLSAVSLLPRPHLSSPNRLRIFPSFHSSALYPSPFLPLIRFTPYQKGPLRSHGRHADPSQPQ
jgi:hypothetical protein